MTTGRIILGLIFNAAIGILFFAAVIAISVLMGV